jgi:hypothetical protein
VAVHGISSLEGIDPSRVSMLVWSASAAIAPSDQGTAFSLEFATLQLIGN